MTSSILRFRRRTATCAIVFALIAMAATEAFASHLRGTTISWAPTGVANQVRFTIKYAERGGSRVIGSAVSISFSFGDGTSGTATGAVTSVNVADDWFLADLSVTHTYSGPGPYTAFYNSCCRISTLKLGHDQTLQMQTTVYPQSGNSSAVASMPPVVTVPIQTTTGFVVSASDINRDTLRYRLATTQEMFNSAPNSAIGQPPGLSIDASTGQVTWNTTAIPSTLGGTPDAGNLWAAQFMVEDLDSSGNVKSKAPIDIILKFVAAVGHPPTLTITPAGPLSVQTGTPVSFTVTGNDVDANARVTLNATGIPPGASATNLNQLLVPPVTSTFTWTPTASQGGSYVISYTATDDTLQQALGSISIFVENNQPPTIGCPAGFNTEYNVAAGVSVQVADPNGDALAVLWKVDGVTVRTDTVPASQNTTTLTLNQTYGSLGNHVVAVTVTDPKSASANCSTTVTVVDTTPAVITTSGDATVEATGPAGAVATFTASASDAVDGAVTASCAPTSGSVFPIGDTLVTCSASDSHGNSAVKTLLVHVVDTTAPGLSLPASITTEATGPAGASVGYTATASDIVDGAVATVCVPVAGSSFGLATTTVNCSATDAHGNAAAGSFSVTVVDTTPPELTVPRDITEYATSPRGATIAFTVTATDIADPNPQVACTAASGSTFTIGTTPVSCTATDASGHSTLRGFLVTVLNNPPIAHDDGVTIDEDATATGNVLANDTDVDGPALSAILMSGTAHGTLTLNGDGSYSYTPAADYNGTDSFTYMVSDGLASGSIGTVAITITPMDDAPVAVNDEATTAEDTIVTGNALDNDSDVDTAHVLLLARIVSGPQHGTAAMDSTGAFTYTPAANYNGGDSFTYVANDGAVDSAPGTVAIIIQAVDDPPVASGDAADTDEDTPVNGNVLANDVDIDNDPLSATLITQPAHGTVALNTDGSYTYTPAGNYNGSDSFTYKVNDGSLDSNEANVDVHVKSVNDNPVCSAAAPTITSLWPADHRLVSVGITGLTDTDGDALSVRVTSVFQDEPTNSSGDGNTAIDGFGIGTSQAVLRAERLGTLQAPGNGRVYRIRFAAEDAHGGSCTGEVKVGVPHDQSLQPSPLDDGPIYDSTVANPPLKAAKK